MRKYLAFDIGGTNLKYGIVTEEAELIYKKIIKIQDTYKELVDYICKIYDETDDIEEVIGISCPESYNKEKKIIEGSSALSYIIGEDLLGDIKKKVNAEVIIENDGNCSLLGEIWNGKAKGKKNVALFVVGTAIGGAICIDGKIIKGVNNSAGELGYMLLRNDVKNMNFNSLGGLSSVGGIVEKTREVHKGKITNGIELFNEFDKNKQLKKAVEEYITYLSLACINIQYIIDPEVIIISGAISSNDKYIDILKEKVDEILKIKTFHKIKPTIVKAILGNDSNLLGIVYKYKQEIEYKT
ncbi:ROK family protein [Clostridium isatidis]|uniref:Sugar kinase n=1 Tax=Clostridium isatidis TaxID=182773 RepID=A0A343JEG2_9CLOT|nr:ROK family protein [Clostridium isatidis]ASW43920.1 hypothetical protein BEN51_10620 [Clostridium isatidis]